jgi:uncharacterized protein
MTPQRRLVLALALAFAMVLPTLITWLYFVALVTDKDVQNPAQQVAYAGGKVVQFLLPLVVVWLVERRLPRPQRPHFGGLLPGAASGLLVAAAMFGLYFGWLANSPILAGAPERVREKVAQMGLASPASYWLLAAAYTLGHSLFEEYYYRWFLFGYLRKLTPLGPAAIASSLAFMAHHVILLYVFLPGQFLVAAVPLSLCIAVGGAFWCWLYERTGTIYAAWVSHGIVDAAIFVLGWILLRRAG